MCPGRPAYPPCTSGLGRGAWCWAGTSPEPPLPREPPCLCSSSEHFRHEAPASRLHPEAVLPPELSSVNQLGCWVAGFGGGPGRSAQGRNVCVCQIMSEPGGLEGAHGASALTYYIAIMKRLPKINTAWVMSDLFRLEGGNAIAGTAASASMFVTVTGQPGESSGIFRPRKDGNKHHKYPGQHRARYISFIQLDEGHLASVNF